MSENEPPKREHKDVLVPSERISKGPSLTSSMLLESMTREEKNAFFKNLFKGTKPEERAEKMKKTAAQYGVSEAYLDVVTDEEN